MAGITTTRNKVLMDDAQERHWKTFGRHLENLIYARKLSVTDFARAADITLTQASRLINGQSGTRRTTIPRIAAALGLDKSEENELYRIAGFISPPAIEEETGQRGTIDTANACGDVVDSRPVTMQDMERLKAWFEEVLNQRLPPKDI